MAKILIVDDEPAINDLIAMNLQMAGHEYDQVYDGKQTLHAINATSYDVALLDIMLPGMDGYELLTYFMQKKIPVIFLTAKEGLADKVKGLKLGAEDYITKPFEGPELIARIEVILRRSGKNNKLFECKNVKVNLEERLVIKDGVNVNLTAQEFSLLETLIQNCNMALTREKLIEQAWGYDYVGETRTVDMHIQRLRKKLDFEDCIKTVYKYGYRLEK